MIDRKIQMVDLLSQFKESEKDIRTALENVFENTAFINGPVVNEFQKNLEKYLDVKHAIPCGNGTDALQIALMALDLKPNDEVIVPAFTFIATAEVIGLLKLKPVIVDVDYRTFNVTPEIIEKAITPKTKAIVPVHLFGQCADMGGIMSLARKHNLYVVEDNAQAIGADYMFPNGDKQKAGTIGHIGCTSFYPSKNLGAFGDGGCIFTNDDGLADKLRMIANHGQSERYYHSEIGVNSRLDAMQAAILDVKLKKLDNYNESRRYAADFYDNAFKDQEQFYTPKRDSFSTHVFHQYTIILKDGERDGLREYLQSAGIPSMVYYPVPLHRQKAFKSWVDDTQILMTTEQLCSSVVSLPIHSEMDEEMLNFICTTTLEYFK